MISAGVIGAGNMGCYHGGILSRQPDARVVAVADTSVERAQSLAVALSCRVAASARELIESAEIDAVVVTTPTSAHRQYVEAAANAGKHVFCEKPLARTMEEGEAMIAAAERAGVKMSVGHVVRWFPQYEQIRRSVLDGTIGKP
nr:Gfo/Idh/MocA family oxidoreductase [Chloroflexota bacterium]